MPANLLQLQGLLEFDPDNRRILLRLVKGYTGYAYGWVEDEWERAEIDGDLSRSEKLRKRAYAMHKRAWRYGERLLQELDNDYGGVARNGTENRQIRQWVQTKLKKKRHAEPLLWCATALAGMVRTAESPGLELEQLTLAKTLVLHAVTLDRSVGQGTGLAFLGAIEASAPPPLGNNHQKSHRYFLEALRISKGQHLVQELQFAQSYAVAVQNRQLFKKLTTKIRGASLKSSQNRLSNVIAKRRARRAQNRTEELFE